MNVVEANGLSMNMVSAYSTDSASVNFGKHKVKNIKNTWKTVCGEWA